MGEEPYWLFKGGFKKERELGAPVPLKNGWIIVRPVSLDEFPVVDIVGDTLDASGNSRKKILNDFHVHPKSKNNQLQWTLADQDGKIYHVTNLFAFLRERPDIFPNARSANAMFSQIIAIRSGTRTHGELTLKNGWTAIDRSDVHDLIERNKPRLAEQMARLTEVKARDKKRTYYAVWYRNEHDYLDYTEEAQRNLALAHVVAFKSEEKRDEWVSEEVAAFRVPCSAYQARYYVHWHQEKIEVIG